MKLHKLLTPWLVLAFLLSTAWIPVVAAPLAGAGVATQISSGGTTSPTTGDFTPSGSGDVTQAEFAGEQDGDSGPSAYAGAIVNRSLSRGTGGGVSVNSGPKAKSNPVFNTGFEGLNH